MLNNRHMRIRIGLVSLVTTCCIASGGAVGDSAVAIASEATSSIAVSYTTNAMMVQTLELNEALQIAMQRNPRIKAALADIEVTEGERIEAGLWENPELGVFSEEIPTASGGISAAKNMVGLSQTVPFLGKKSLERKAADLSIEEARNEYLATERDVIRDVKIAYFQVLASQHSVEIFEELAALSQSLATTADKRLKAGEAPAQELLRAEIECQRANSATEQSQGELLEARQRLATLLGRSDLENTSLSGELSSESNGTLAQLTSRELLQDHPRMKQAHLAVQVAEADYKRSRRQYLPDVTVEAAYGSRDSELEGRENLAEISLSFPLPLIDHGQGAKRTSGGVLDVARAHLEETEQDLLEQFGNTMTRLQTATKRVSTYHDAILPKIDKALSLMQRGFQEGKFSFIDLLDTQRTVVESRLDYQEALLEMNTAEATLESLLVQETPKDEEE